MKIADKNELLTDILPGSPAGNLLRSYWLPVALTEELARRNPVTVNVLGEKLVLFRDASKRLGLLDDRCAHRGTSLSAGSDKMKTSGRIDRRGVRCPYHGWLYDPTGQCLHQPAEPADSKAYEKVRIKAYPVAERYGFIWAFLGEGEAPAIPPLDVLARDDGIRINTIGRWPCNYFQVCENLVDPAHVSVLHLETDFDQPLFSAMPTVRAEATQWGLKTIAGRPGYEREVEYLFPTCVRLALPIMQPPIAMAFWIVPVSNTESLSFHAWFLPLASDVPQAERDAKFARMKEFIYELDDSDPAYHASKVNAQDKFACYSQGVIADRSLERLATSDVGVVLLRRLFLAAIEDVEAGRAPRGLQRSESKTIIEFPNVF